MFNTSSFGLSLLSLNLTQRLGYESTSQETSNKIQGEHETQIQPVFGHLLSQRETQTRVPGHIP